MMTKLVTLSLFTLALCATMMTADDKKVEKPKDDKPGTNPVVVMETSVGTIEIELYPDKAPVTVENFLKYTDDKFYDGLIFHRVISTFMIQGGGYEPGLKKKKTSAAIKNEADNGLSNTVGTIAMARTSEPDTATSQFFINVEDNSMKLDKAHVPDKVGYCVFGKVVAGLDVVEKIKEVKCETNPDNMRETSKPIEDVVIKSVKRKPVK